LKYLLDTVVLSELRKARPSKSVIAWFNGTQSKAVFISVISIGEIERGIAMRRRGGNAEDDFADELTQWLENLLTLYADRVLPITAPIARRWGMLSAQLNHDGADLLIAATALEHKLAVVTRNVKHFRPTGAIVVNPFLSR
jgi:toxin FitB